MLRIGVVTVTESLGWQTPNMCASAKATCFITPTGQYLGMQEQHNLLPYLALTLRAYKMYRSPLQPLVAVGA